MPANPFRRNFVRADRASPETVVQLGTVTRDIRADGRTCVKAVLVIQAPYAQALLNDAYASGKVVKIAGEDLLIYLVHHEYVDFNNVQVTLSTTPLAEAVSSAATPQPSRASMPDTPPVVVVPANLVSRRLIT